MAKIEQTKGLCKYCGKEFARSGMLRHLPACKERKAVLKAEAGECKCGYFELLISAKYNDDYWLIIEMPETAALSDLDQFIRDIWVECCSHESLFDIRGELYESVPDFGAFWENEFGIEGEPGLKAVKLRDVLSKGLVFRYEYDMGSTTELIIKVQDCRVGIWQAKTVTILSRNNPVEILCCHCKKNKAELINPERYYEEDAFWCEECLIADIESEEDEEEQDEEWKAMDIEEKRYVYSLYDFFLPVCNSPRMGVCGYEGSRIYPDQFEPDDKDKAGK